MMDINLYSPKVLFECELNFVWVEKGSRVSPNPQSPKFHIPYDDHHVGNFQRIAIWVHKFRSALGHVGHVTDTSAGKGARPPNF
jgi:hypothetical protein